MPETWARILPEIPSSIHLHDGHPACHAPVWSGFTLTLLRSGGVTRQEAVAVCIGQLTITPGWLCAGQGVIGDQAGTRQARGAKGNLHQRLFALKRCGCGHDRRVCRPGVGVRAITPQQDIEPPAIPAAQVRHQGRGHVVEPEPGAKGVELRADQSDHEACGHGTPEEFFGSDHRNCPKSGI